MTTPATDRERAAKEIETLERPEVKALFLYLTLALTIIKEWDDPEDPETGTIMGMEHALAAFTKLKEDLRK